MFYKVAHWTLYAIPIVWMGLIALYYKKVSIGKEDYESLSTLCGGVVGSVAAFLLVGLFVW